MPPTFSLISAPQRSRLSPILTSTVDGSSSPGPLLPFYSSPFPGVRARMSFFITACSSPQAYSSVASTTNSLSRACRTIRGTTAAPFTLQSPQQFFLLLRRSHFHCVHVLRPDQAPLQPISM